VAPTTVTTKLLIRVDVHTAHGDVADELADVREAAVGEATEVRALELGRLDAMIDGLWPQVREGRPPAVSAAVRRRVWTSALAARRGGYIQVAPALPSGPVGVEVEGAAVLGQGWCAVILRNVDRRAQIDRGGPARVEARADRAPEVLLTEAARST